MSAPILQGADTHVAVVVALLLAATAAAFFLPIGVPAMAIFVWVPIAYAVFVVGALLCARLRGADMSTPPKGEEK